MNQAIRVTKKFTFEAAHALDGYSGKCKDIHGHSYKLSVTLRGEPNTNIEDEKCGMLIDFSDLKTIVETKIISLFDHRLILRDDSRFKGIEIKNSRVRYVSYQPTCENMLLEILRLLQPEFSIENDLELVHLVLYETANSASEWRIEDNL